MTAMLAVLPIRATMIFSLSFLSYLRITSRSLSAFMREDFCDSSMRCRVGVEQISEVHRTYWHKAELVPQRWGVAIFNSQKGWIEHPLRRTAEKAAKGVLICAVDVAIESTGVYGKPCGMFFCRCCAWLLDPSTSGQTIKLKRDF